MLKKRFQIGLLGLLISLNAFAAEFTDNPIPIPDAKIGADQASNTITTSLGTVANVTVITAKQIQQMGATNVAQIFRHYAGLQVQDLYGDGSQVQLSFAGFGENSTSNVKVMIDGVPLNNPDLSSLNLSSISISNIDRIEILNGSSAILYGDGAVGGVINIITKKPEKFSGHIGLSDSSYEQRGGSASMGNTQGPWQYSLNGQYQQGNGYRTYNQNSTGNYEGRIVYNAKNSSIGLHVQQVDNQEQYPGSLTEQQLQSDPTQIGEGYGYFNSVERITDVLFKHFWNTHWGISNTLAIRQFQGYGEFTSSAFDQTRSVYTLNPIVTGRYETKNGPLLIKMGLLSEKDLYKISYVDWQDQRLEHNYYSALTLPVAKAWQLLAGVRFAQANSSIAVDPPNNSIDNRALINSVELAWQTTDTLRWYLRQAGNYRFPKLDEYSTTSNTPPLQTQTGVTYASGLAYHWQRLDSRLDLYQLNLKNEIAYDPTPQPGEPFGTNTNLDPTQRRGLLLTESLQALNNWQVGAEYAYVDGIFTSGNFSGNRIPLVAREKLTAFSMLDITPQWSWYLAAIYVGDRYPGSDYANTQATLNATMVVNTNVGYHINHWRMALQCNNLGNSQYLESAYLSGDEVGYYPAPERNFLFSTTYEF